MNEVVDFILRYYFIAMQYTGIAILLYMAFIKRSKIVRIQWNSVGSFVGFMTLITALRFGLMDGDPNPDFGQDVTSFKHFVWVFWEDAFFAMPIYYVKDHLKLPKSVWIPVVVGLSLTFGSIHLAYGFTWAAIVCVYPYIFSYKFSKLYGFGTVMACHIIYDFMTHASVKVFQAISMMH